MPAQDASGVIATLGGRFGGWGLYLLEGKPVFDYNMLMLAHYRWVGNAAADPGQTQHRLRLHL